MRSPSIQIASLDDDVFGEVTLAPCAHTGLSEAQLARAMSAQIRPPRTLRLAPQQSVRDGLPPSLPAVARL